VELYDENKAQDDAWAFLRSNSTATLKFGEHTKDVSYVICPDGLLVIPAMVAMLQPSDTLLFVPEYMEDCMEIHVSLSQFTAEGKNGARADRWQVYHGEPPDVQWAMLDIDAARFHEMFIDGDGLCRENPLASEEPAICKELNTNKQDKLRVLCKTKTNVDVTNPTVVGVDALGIDVRAPFGIVRVPSNAPLESPADVFSFLQD